MIQAVVSSCRFVFVCMIQQVIFAICACEIECCKFCEVFIVRRFCTDCLKYKVITRRHVGCHTLRFVVVCSNHNFGSVFLREETTLFKDQIFG